MEPCSSCEDYTSNPPPLVLPQVSPGPVAADRPAVRDRAGLCGLRPGALQGHEPLREGPHVLSDVAHDKSHGGQQC